MAQLLTTTIQAGLTLTSDKIAFPSTIQIGNSNTSASGANTIAIGNNATTGNFGDTIALGNGATSSSDQRLTLPSSYNVYASAVITTSDRNDKTDISPIANSCTDFLMALEPSTFRFNYRSDYPVANPDPSILSKYGIPEYDEKAHEKAKKAHDRTHAGFIAQDVYEKLAEYNIPFDLVNKDGIDDKRVIKEGYERYYLNYSAFIPLLVKVIQEQEVRIKTLESELEILKNK